jgi:hypothetical protein
MVHRYSYTLTNYTCRDEYRIVTVASSIDADTGHLSDQAYRRLDRSSGRMCRYTDGVRSILVRMSRYRAGSNGSSVQPLAESHDCLFSKQSIFQDLWKQCFTFMELAKSTKMDDLLSPRMV